MGKPRDGRPHGKSYKNRSKGDNLAQANRRKKTEWNESPDDVGDMLERLSISGGEEEEEEGKNKHLFQ